MKDWALYKTSGISIDMANISPKGTKKNRGKSRSNRKSSGAKAKPTKALTTAVTKIINRHLESRYIRETIVPEVVFFNSTITGAADWYRVIPLIGRGDNTNQRQGDKIQPKSLKINWTFRFAYSDQNTRDVYVVLYLLTSKSNKSYNTTSKNSALASNFNQYLDNGNDSTTYFSGTWQDAQKPINRENFTLLSKKVIHLCKGSGLANGSGVIGPALVDSSGNVLTDVSGNVLRAAGSDGMYTHERSVRANYSYTFKSLPTEFLYSDVNLTYPANFAPVWAVGYYYADGTSPDTAGGLLGVACETHLYYKDG